jgi:hypothetical protein
MTRWWSKLGSAMFNGVGVAVVVGGDGDVSLQY